MNHVLKPLSRQDYFSSLLERTQTRLVKTLGTLPEAVPVFQGNVRMFPVDEYVFLYEHHPASNEVHVLDMIAPGRSWR